MLLKNMLKKAALLSFLTLSVAAANTLPAYAENMRDSQDIVNEMGVGWDLGNSLDASYDGIAPNSSSSVYETSWNNPVTSKAMIDEIKKAGFKTVRIPITWGPHVGAAPEYKISEDWLNRVQEVVDYCKDNGLYTIINVHHDSNWCTPTYSAEKEATKKLQKIWTQVANRFKNYDDHLIFEALNEPRVIYSAEEWTGGTKEGREVVNRYNEAALKAIRATGGNNADRSVMVPSYAASPSANALSDFKVPQDDNVIVSLHNYSPYEFAMNAYGTDWWGSDEDKRKLDAELDNFYNTFVSKGIPVVIGEFGSVDKNNLSSRETHARYYVSSVLKRNMACIWWDNNRTRNTNGGSAETFGIFNRENLSWHFPTIKDALIAGYTDVKGQNSNTGNDNNNNNNGNNNSNNNNDGNNNTGNNNSDNNDNSSNEDKNDNSDKDNNNANNNDSNNDSNGGQGNNGSADSDFTVTKDLNSWFVGYQMNLTITNNTDSDMDSWRLKIKKSDISILVSWDADLSTDGEYTVFTPKDWKRKIPAGQSITVSFQGLGPGTTEFDYVLSK